MVSWVMYYRIFLKTIMKKCFIFYIHANLSSKMLTAWLIAVILLLVVQCMVVRNVVLSNSFLRCHNRFCPTCGTKYSIDRTTSMSFKIINTQHRHCVFTIDSELRHFFLENRKLLGLLFDAVQSVIFRAFYKDNKSECFTPGFILVLHTFGRELKWNPHIHCLVSEGGIGNSGLCVQNTLQLYFSSVMHFVPRFLILWKKKSVLLSSL